MVKSETCSDFETRFFKIPAWQNDALKSETPWLITKVSEVWNQVNSFQNPQFSRYHSVCILCKGCLNGVIKTTLTQDSIPGEIEMMLIFLKI